MYGEILRLMENEEWHHEPEGTLHSLCYKIVGDLVSNLAEES